MEIITKSPEETFEFGQKFGRKLKDGEILALVGDLGSGKTTFIQGVADGLGIKNRIISPTFILMRSYIGNKTLYHLDLYRLEENVPTELQNLGIDDIWQDEKNITVIEWADKAKEIFPPNSKWIYFENIGGDERKITI